MIRFAVKAELLDEDAGSTVVLRYFDTREEAEEHPVKLSLWKRVWVEQVPPAPPSRTPIKPPATLRLPWSREDPHGFAFTYLRDADGHRIASLLGKAEQRDRICQALADKGMLEE